MLILASGSPRRAEILTMLGYKFTVEVADCDESVGEMNAADAVALLSRRKAQAVADLHGNEPETGTVVLGSDTLVTLDGKVLGKPRDNSDARRMLRMLSGRTHTVYTGVTVIGSSTVTEVSAAHVTFGNLSDSDISRYIATGEPSDKAGAYGIQGRGAVLIDRIEGDFFTVMGLPARMCAEMLSKCGIYPNEK